MHTAGRQGTHTRWGPTWQGLAASHAGINLLRQHPDALKHQLPKRFQDARDEAENVGVELGHSHVGQHFGALEK